MTLLSLLCVTIGLLVFLLGTESGLRLSFNVATRIIPGNLEINHLQGRLLGTVHAKGVSYQQDNVTVQADTISVVWQAFALLSGTVNIQSLNANNTTIIIQKKESQEQEQVIKEAEPFYFPLHLVFADIQLDNTELHTPNRRIFIDKTILAGEVNHTDLTLTTLSLQNKRRQIELTGTAHWLPPYPVDLQLQINSSETAKLPLDGNAHLHGNIHELTIDASTNQPFRFQFDAQLTALDNNSMQTFPDFQWQAKLQGDDIDPSNYWSVWPGKIDFIIDSSGDWQDKHLNGKLILQSLSGEINQLPLSGQGTITRKNSIFHFNQIAFMMGDNQLTINGHLAEQYDLIWQLDINRLEQFLTHSHGAFSSHGQISGQPDDAYLSAKLVSDSIDLPNGHLSDLQASATFALNPASKSNIDISLANFNYATLQLNSLNFHAGGSQQQHQINSQFNLNNQQFDIAINGQYNQAKWLGQWQALTVNTDNFGRWQLQRTATTTITAKHIKVDPLCWSSNQQSLCLHGEWQKDQLWQIALHAKQLSGHLLQAWLPENTQLDTQIDIDAQLTMDHQDIIDGEINLSSAPGTFHSQLGSTEHHFTFQEGSLHTQIDSSGLQADASLNINPYNQATAKLQLPDYHYLQLPNKQQAIQMNAQANFNDLSLLSTLTLQLRDVQGKLTSTISINGSLGEPSINGNLSLQEGEASLPSLGIHLNNATVQAQTEGSNRFNITGSVESGSGNINVNGSALLDSAGLTAQLDIQGENIEVINTEEYQALISPEIHLTVDNHLLDINGDIVIPQARITPADFSRSISLPADVVIIDEQQTPTRTPIALTSRIHFILGDDIELDFMGLSGNLQGELTVTDGPNQATTANGELEIVNGEFSDYGQELTIEYGYLRYVGGLIDNPVVNIRASRSIRVSAGGLSPLVTGDLPIPQFTTGQALPSLEEITIGVDITGQAQDPNISLFSIPNTFSQADILSLLVLGEPLSQVSEASTSVLLQAASTLNIGGTQSSQLLNQLQDTFGIDQIGLESQSSYDPNLGQVTTSTALMISKAFSPRLYFSYGIGLVDQRSIIRMRYLLTNNWSIQSETDGQNNGIDLFYSIER